MRIVSAAVAGGPAGGHIGGVLLALLLACSPPDPDALLRAEDLPGVAAAWEKAYGVSLDVAHPIAPVLARRARVDPSVTAADLARALTHVALLDAVPRLGLRGVDLSFPTAASLLGAAELLARGTPRVAVGRSENAMDRDPMEGGALPWARGRVCGYATGALVPVGALVDREAPPKLVTFVVEDDTGPLMITAEWRSDGWWSHSSNDPEAAARLLLAADVLATEGAAAVRARYPATGLRGG